MAAEIVIVDDDPVVGNLTSDVLRDAGYSTLWVRDCAQAETVIRSRPPRLAIVDIMMPGVDGITLLTTLKSDPIAKNVKFVVVSGKSFPADKKRALAAGADLFIDKPFDVDSFPRTITQLIGAPSGAGAEESAPKASIAVKVWGCRGPEGPAPAGSKAGTLGPCLSVETPERVFAFDAGSGLSAFGLDIAARAPGKELWVLLTHAHPGHLAGLSDFKPASAQGRVLKIAGPTSPDEKLKDVVKRALASAKAKTQAKIELYELLEDGYEPAAGVRLAAMFAHHPGTTLALSLEFDTRKIVYAADSELAGEDASSMNDYDEKLARFCRGADLLIHDAHFTSKDFSPGSGHSSASAAVALGVAAGARELWLTHFNPAYTDAQIDELEAAAKAEAEKSGLRCRAAREGLTQPL